MFLIGPLRRPVSQSELLLLLYFTLSAGHTFTDRAPGLATDAIRRHPGTSVSVSKSSYWNREHPCTDFLSVEPF